MSLDSAEPLKSGDRLGDYVVDRTLGKGGMGVVYLARTSEGSEFALKVMYPDKVTNEFRRRFAREAEFAMKVRHRNLVTVYDVGEDPATGLCYIIMDYIPGGSLTEMLKKKGRLSVSEAVSITVKIAAGLEVAHRCGVVHRDVKPDNILFDSDGTPRLADLGVAKFDDGRTTMVTMAGSIIGTPAYMSPEQLMDSHRIDARADIYSLGIVLYEMLAGKRPNNESTAVELLAKAIKGEELPDIRKLRPEVSAAIAHVISLMCASDPQDRPKTSISAADLLNKAASGRLILPQKPPEAAKTVMHGSKADSLRRYAIIGGMVAVVGVSIAAIAIALSNKSRPYAEKAGGQAISRNSSDMLLPVGIEDFEVMVTGVAVVNETWNPDNGENVEFLPPKTLISVPFGKRAAFKLKYSFPKGYGARIWTSCKWPSSKSGNYVYFVRYPSPLYYGQGTAYGFIMMRDRGKSCTLEMVKVSTKTEPELDEYPNGWILGTSKVHIDFVGKDG